MGLTPVGGGRRGDEIQPVLFSVGLDCHSAINAAQCKRVPLQVLPLTLY